VRRAFSLIFGMKADTDIRAELGPPLFHPAELAVGRCDPH